MNGATRLLSVLAPTAALTLFDAPSAHAQGAFQRTLAGSVVGGQFSSTRQTSDGGYVLAGTTFQGAGSTDVLLLKLDASGDMQWARTFGGAADNEYGHDVQQAPDGGYVIAARSYTFGPGWYDAYVIKTDANGDLEWSRTLGGAENDKANSIALTSDGGYIVAGETSNFGAGGIDFYLFRLDSAGNLLWTTTWGGIGTEYGHSVQQTADGGFVVAGYGGSFGPGFWDVFLMKTDSAGNVQWGKAYGGSDDERAYSVVQTSDGGYAVAGYSAKLGGAGSWDAYLIKTDGSGNLLWSKAYGGASIDIANAVLETSDGGLVLAGETLSFGAGSRDFYVVKTDGAGNELWSNAYGRASSDRAYSVEETADGGLVIHGDSAADFYVVKTESAGESGCDQAAAATVTTNTATSSSAGGSVSSGGTWGNAATVTTVPTMTEALFCESGCGEVYCDANPDNAADIAIDTCDCGAGSIVISMSGGPPTQFGYLLIGAGNGVVLDPPGAQGELCLGGAPIGRYNLDAALTDGAGALSTDILNAVSGGGGGGIPSLGGNVCAPVGQSWNFQYWHRDGVDPSRFSKAIAVTFQ